MAFAAAGLGIVVSAAVFELGGRLIWLRLESEWSERMGRISYYYQRSANPILGYELAPGFELAGQPKYVRIGADGLRVTEGTPEHPLRGVGVAGDSVVFGIGHEQGHTPADFLQSGLNDHGSEPARVFNLGVPGYSAAEIREFFQTKVPLLDLSAAVLVLNLNDFSRRESIYEGGDNGLYRMYSAPQWYSVYFLRKAVYRWNSGYLFRSSRGVPPEWYRWLFRANRQIGIGQIEQMHNFANQRGIRFGVVLFPSGGAYRESGEYELDDIHRELQHELTRLGIPSHDAAGAFRESHERLIDVTDHPTVEGNQKLATVIAEFMEIGF